MTLRTPACPQQRGQARVAVARVVAHDRQVPGALLDEGVDELGRHAGQAESADQHGSAVRGICHRVECGGRELRPAHQRTQADTTVMTVWPIVILSRFFSNW